MLRSIFCILLLASSFLPKAQDTLAPLMFNEGLRQSIELEHHGQNITRDIERKPFIYLVDTITLPFFDDFTKDKIKVYDAEKTDDNISLKVLFGFTVNGDHPEVLDLVYEPTYSKTKPISGPVILEENPVLYVTFYDEVGEPISYDTGWTNIITEFDEGQSIVSYDTIDADITYQNSFDTLYLVADDASHWITPGNESGRGGAYINNSFQRENLTQGVATFDGTDALGEPYNITSETAYGPADTLESKPFLLDENMVDVFFSFFYQEGGYGNAPEAEDTLVLEFFDVENETWRHVWSKAGGTGEIGVWNDQVIIRIADPEFLQPGFQFRFRNYATLAGAFDMWHIDYIRLDENRDSASADTIIDVAMLTQLSSFTGEYTSVPYDHYIENHSILQADTVKLDVRNLGVEAVNVLNINYEVFDNTGTSVDFFTTSDLNLPANTIRRYNYLLESDQIFPDLGSETETFDVTAWYTISGNNAEFINDTIRSTQHFAKYYSYDDGSAEQAYALTGTGLELAYEFTTPKADSLRGFWINFPKVLVENAEDFDIELLVWEDTASDPIYTSEIPVSPIYSGANSFVRYDLETPVFVDGAFYIGFRQLQADKIYIGFDRNTNSREHILYKTGDKWFTSSFDGSLLLRPDFGLNPSLNLPRSESQNENVSLYPNPTTGIFQVNTALDKLNVELINLSGQTVFSQSITNNDQISLHHLSSGIYFVKCVDENGYVFSTKKLVISK